MYNNSTMLFFALFFILCSFDCSLNFLQVVVGILFLVIGGLNINEEPKQRTADILNDVIVVVIFLITLVNVIISGFGIRHTDENVQTASTIK